MEVSQLFCNKGERDLSWWLRVDLEPGEMAACLYPGGNAAGPAEGLAQCLACGGHSVQKGFHRCPHSP